MANNTAGVLYKWPECWGLPSLSPACVQAEAYLRFCEATFAAEPCTTSGNSPTGQLPALERNEYVSTAEADEFAAARSIIAYAKKQVRDLDAHLTPGQRAELLAFTTMVEVHLNLATTVTTWLEPKGFAEFKKAAFGTKLPFPLNHLVPWSQQRDVRRRCLAQQADPHQAYQDACNTIGALADKLAASGGRFFFGAGPTSLDALVIGHLLYYRHSPAAAPALRDKVLGSPALCIYLDTALEATFARAVPSKAELEEATGTGWTSAAKGEKKAPPPKIEPTQAELDFRRHSRYWLLGAGTAVVSYILMSGRYIQFTNAVQQAAGFDDGGEDDEGDDEEGHVDEDAGQQ